MRTSESRKDPRTNRARALRRNATVEERMIWVQLRQLEVGCHFRRQVPIGPYFADFACLTKKLIVELDGSQHAEPNHLLKDEKRDAWFQEQGFAVLRFWNNEVHETMDGVIDTILAAFGHVETEIFPTGSLQFPPPTLDPSPQQVGGGKVLNPYLATLEIK